MPNTDNVREGFGFICTYLGWGCSWRDEIIWDGIIWDWMGIIWDGNGSIGHILFRHGDFILAGFGRCITYTCI